MLLRAFLHHFDKLEPEKYRTLGASSAGSCARRLAYAHFPEHFTPEPMTARRRARLMAGREYERICLDTVVKELPSSAARETPFLWPVKVDAETVAAAVAKVNSGRIVGHVLDGMNPNDIPRWRAACAARGMTRLGGIVVDCDASIVYLPALADFVADMSEHFPGYGLAVGDFKTIASAGFRKVLDGVLDYSYRTQFAIQADAADLDTFIALYYRLETSHGVEIIYSRRATGVRATFHLSNNTVRVVEGTIDVPADEWDEVTVETPFDDRLLEQARARIRRVLNATAEALPAREYGPDFTCDKCDGYGEVKCALCDEDGIAKRSKKKKDGTPKDGKPCSRSNGRPTMKCDECHGDGLADEAELGFPCGWCPFLSSCYPMARIEIPKKSFARPRILVPRDEFQKAA